MSRAELIADFLAHVKSEFPPFVFLSSLPASTPPAAAAAPVAPIALPPPVPRPPVSAPILAPAPLVSAPPVAPIASVVHDLVKRLKEVHYLETPPSDRLAKKRAERWKAGQLAARFLVIGFDESPSHARFLQSLAAAINIHFQDAKWIDGQPLEKNDLWEELLKSSDLKQIFLSDSSLWQMTRLRRFYKETNPSGRFLKEVPLFLLPDLSLYFKDPLLKKSLWKAVEHVCQSPS